MAEEQTPTDFYLPNDIVSVILARLPAKSLAQSRTVSQDWRRLASDSYVLLEHNRHQPSEPRVTILSAGGNGSLPHSVGAVDLRTYTTQRVLEWFTHAGDDIYYPPEVHASCEGLILLSLRHNLYVGNPTTRQGTFLPPIHEDHSCGIMGLYRRVGSGEYRVLYFRQLHGHEATYHTLTVGFPEQAAANIEPPPRARNRLGEGTRHAMSVPPILVSRSLHWHPVGPSLAGENMLAFHTGTQLFRWIPPPPSGRVCEHTPLFDMEGKLALLVFFRDEWGAAAELWVLPDENQPWVYKYMFGLVMPDDVNLGWEVYVYQEGDILVARGPQHLVWHLGGKDWISVKSFNLVADGWSMTSYALKESPALHHFLQTVAMTDAA